MKDAFIFLTRSPETAPRILKKFQQAAKHSKQDFDFHICTYQEECDQKVSKVEVNGELVNYWTFGKKDAFSLGYSAKVIPENWIFIPGNADVVTINFFKKNNNYARYWQFEDDVDYSGDATDLLDTLSDYKADLLCTHLERGWNGWTYNSRFTKGSSKEELKPEDTFLCFLPLRVITHDGLCALDQGYKDGWAGHFEQVWPTMLIEKGLTVCDIGGSGEFVAPENINKHYFGTALPNQNKTGSFTPTPPRLFMGRKPNTLWHPVKTFDQWFSGKVRRMKSIGAYYRSRLFK